MEAPREALKRNVAMKSNYVILTNAQKRLCERAIKITYTVLKLKREGLGKKASRILALVQHQQK